MKILFPILALSALANASAREISLNDCPPAVRETIRQGLGGGHIDDIDLIQVNGKAKYIVDIDGPGRRDVTLRINANGKLQLTSEDLRFNDCPQPIKKAINKLVAEGWRLDDIDRETSGKTVKFRVDFDGRNSRDLEVLLDAKGKVLKRQIFPDFSL